MRPDGQIEPSKRLLMLGKRATMGPRIGSERASLCCWEEEEEDGDDDDNVGTLKETSEEEELMCFSPDPPQRPVRPGRCHLPLHSP